MKSNYCLLKDECGYSIYTLGHMRIEKGHGEGREELYRRIVELDAFDSACDMLGDTDIDRRRLMFNIKNSGRYHGRTHKNIPKIIASAIINYNMGL